MEGRRFSAGVKNNAEEIRGRFKTKTNIKVRRESGVTKIDGVDDDEIEGTGRREAF